MRAAPTDITYWLEWAAVKLITLPAGPLKPRDPRALWPDYVRDALPGLADLRTNRIRALAPTSDEIPIMDLITALPLLCDNPDARRIINWRAQIHPLSGRHLLTWPWIAHKLGAKVYTARQLHTKGLHQIAVRVPHATVCRISTFFNPNAISA